MLEPGLPYHVYNRGNNRQPIFLREENYWYFIEKMKKHLLPFCDILAFCLMPNHFHIQLVPKPCGCEFGDNGVTKLHGAIRTILSSYTQAINKREGRTGSLFQQKTKIKLGWGEEISERKLYDLNIPFSRQMPYVVTCFRYIHLNPVKAKLVEHPYGWKYSSALDYVGERDIDVCNFELANQLLGIRRLSGIDEYIIRKKDFG